MIEAAKVQIEAIRIQNEKDFQSGKSRKAINLLADSFPEVNMYILELIQNAVDAGATCIAIQVDDADLEFSHDGQPLRIENIKAMSDIASSTKGLESVGFMGVGFKSIFGRFLKVQVRDGAYTFRYEQENVAKKGKNSDVEIVLSNRLGMVLPTWDDTVPYASFPDMQTSFFFSQPYKNKHEIDILKDVKGLLYSADGDTGPLPLAVLATGHLRRFIINETEYSISKQGSVVSISSAGKRWQWLCLEDKYIPSDEAGADLIRKRVKEFSFEDIDPDLLMEKAKTERSIFGFVPLDDEGWPLPPERGQIFTLLPTNVDYCFGLHLQAPWLLDITRKNLVEIETSTWQQEIVSKIPNLLRQYLSFFVTKLVSLETYSEQKKMCHLVLSVLAYPKDKRGIVDRFIWKEDGLQGALLSAIQKIPILLTHREKQTVFSSIDDSLWLHDSLVDDFCGASKIYPGVLFGHSIVIGNILAQKTRSFFLKLSVPCFSLSHAKEAWPKQLQIWKESIDEDDFVKYQVLLNAGLLEQMNAERNFEWKEYNLCLTQSGEWLPFHKMKNLSHIPLMTEIGGKEVLEIVSQRYPHFMDARIERYFKSKIENRMSHKKECSVWEYFQENSSNIFIEQVLQNHFEILNLRPETIEKQVVLPSLWCIEKKLKISYFLVEGTKLQFRSESACILGFPYSSEEENLWKQKVFQVDTELSALYWKYYLQWYQKVPQAKLTETELKERLTVRLKFYNFVGERLFKIVVSEENNRSNFNDSYLPCINGDEQQLGKNGTKSTSNPMYTIYTPRFTFEITDDNREVIHLLLEKNKIEIESKKVEIEYFYKSSKTCHSLVELPWMKLLKQNAWVPDGFGNFYLPENILSPNENSDDYGDEPIAAISADLYKRLESHGIKFGKDIPKSSIVRRLAKKRGKISETEFLEQIRTLFNEANYYAYIEELQGLLQSYEIAPNILFSRLVKPNNPSLLGGFLQKVEKDSDLEKAIQLLEKHGVLEIPKEPSIKQVTQFLKMVWGETKTGSVQECYRDALPKAYNYLQVALEIGTLNQQDWCKLREQAVLFGKSTGKEKWFSLSGETKLFIDNIRNSFIRQRLPASVTFLMMSHLGDEYEQQIQMANKFGLDYLENSSIFAVEYGSVLDWSSIQGGGQQKELFQQLIDILCKAKRRVNLNLVLLSEIKITIDGNPIQVRCYLDEFENTFFVSGETEDYSDEAGCCLQDYFSLSEGLLPKIVKFLCLLSKNKKSRDILKEIAQYLEVEFLEESDVFDVVERKTSKIEPSTEDRVVEHHLGSLMVNNEIKHFEIEGESLSRGQSQGKRSFSSRGSQRNRASKKQHRLVSYLQPDIFKQNVFSEEQDTDTESLTQSGKIGEEFALQQELLRCQNAKLMPENNPGYDIESEKNGQKQYIEVKSVEGTWGERGVSISARQFREAIEQGENWWLYVVENVLDDPILHRIPNPVLRINQFQIDVAWKALAQNDDLNPNC